MTVGRTKPSCPSFSKLLIKFHKGPPQETKPNKPHNTVRDHHFLRSTPRPPPIDMNTTAAATTMNEHSRPIPPTRTYSARDRMTLLPEDFSPSDDDVICGRGKKCYAHVGNDRFRERVMGMLDEYRKARSKLDKSKVLSDVVEQVRMNSPLGGFVKQDSNGRWHEVGDFLAREKTSQAFRDALHENYKSSNVSKKKRRQQEVPRENVAKHHSDSDIQKRMAKLTFGFGKTRSDERFRDFFERPTASTELRHDYHRARSYSSSRHSPSPRLSSTNIEATTEMNISELRGVENSFKPFYFHGRERAGSSDTRSEVMSRSRRSRASSNRRSHSYSLPSSPMTAPTVFDETPLDLYHSVPNMHFSFDSSRAEPPINEMEAFQHSAPNLYYERESEHDMDPLLVELDIPDLSSKRVATAAPVVVSSSSAPMETDDEPMTISSSLIESLAKITESAATDDNPFEPIPLSPASKRRPSVVMSKADFSNIEEDRSLGDAFEEEDYKNVQNL